MRLKGGGGILGGEEFLSLFSVFCMFGVESARDEQRKIFLGMIGTSDGDIQ